MSYSLRSGLHELLGPFGPWELRRTRCLQRLLLELHVVGEVQGEVRHGHEAPDVKALKFTVSSAVFLWEPYKPSKLRASMICSYKVTIY